MGNDFSFVSVAYLISGITSYTQQQKEESIIRAQPRHEAVYFMARYISLYIKLDMRI
jgi:hypothetical protein